MIWRRTITPMLIITFILVQFIPAASSTSWRAAAVSYTDWAQFISDVTVPDGTTYTAGATFTKTWRLKNIGTKTWTTSYALVFDSGSQLDAPAVVNLSGNIAPGQTVDLTVNMTAPTTVGHYRGYWKMRSTSGVLFGIGYTGKSSFWVDINVTASASLGFDFAANACSATWTSGAGGLSCPGTDGSASGFVLNLSAPQLENGSTDTAPGLLVSPQNVTNGYIQGVYPEFTVQSGDRFQTTVSCQYGATSCYVQYKLQYQIGSGAVQTLWTFRERYEGWYYRASIDLSALAGQNVKFILYVNTYGSAAGDRALWGSPRIVRSGAGTTPTETTPTGPTPTLSSACDRAAFIADVTVPDGSAYSAGATFTKTWRLRNNGTCTWTTAYALAFVSGDLLGAAATVNLPASVAPGQTVDLSVNMTSPSANGHYRGYWKLRNSSGVQFGLSTASAHPFWVDINVVGTYGSAYDFVTNACAASWTSAAGALPCPGMDGDAKGFVLKYDTATTLENGVAGGPGLLTFPQNVTNGYIQGVYPAYTVQSGDRFQSIVNCEYSATACYVTFRLDYQIGSGSIRTLKVFRERYEGSYYQMDVNLSALVGQNVKFILTVLSTGSPTGDRALWVTPRIARIGAGTTPAASTATTTKTPTLTLTGATAVTSTATRTATSTATSTRTMTSTATANTPGWTTYQNTTYGFRFMIPPGASIVEQTNTHGRVNLPFTAGKNLIEKYIEVSVVEGLTPCVAPAPGSVSSSQTVTINGIPFFQQVGTDAGAGQIYEWTAYSTSHNSACISLNFILHSANLGVYPTPAPPLFDKVAESAIFSEIMATFNWLP